MKLLLACTALLFSLNSFPQTQARYRVLPGILHDRGTIITKILPDPSKYDVQMIFDIQKKNFVPVADQLLKGDKIYEFPVKFRSEQGYKNLEQARVIDIPKAIIKFQKRANSGKLKNAYFFQVLPKNKKTKIDIVYHPSLPSLGWSKVKITFLSELPLLDGYEVEAVLEK